MFHKNDINPTWIVLAIAAISGIGVITNTYDPQNTFALGMFFLCIFMLIFSILSLILNNTKRPFLWSTLLTTLLFVRSLKLFDLIYIILLLAIALSLELYWRKR